MNRLSIRSIFTLSLMVPSVQAMAASTPNSSLGEMMQLTLGLFVVLAIMIFILRMMRRFGFARGDREAGVRVVSGVGLGGRERVVVLEVADQWLVVGVSPGNVNMLHVLPKQSDLPRVSQENTKIKSFAQLVSAKFQRVRGV